MDYDTQQSTGRPNLRAKPRVDHSDQLAVSDSEDVARKRRKRTKQDSRMEELVTMMAQVLRRTILEML